MESTGSSKGFCRENVDKAAEVFAQHGDFIRKIIDYRVNDKAWVDDIFQDIFLCLIYKPLPKDVGNVRSYLYKAITNDVYDALRRVKRYQSKVVKLSDEGHRFVIEDNPEKTLIKEEEINKMFSMIEKRLPYSEAKAITLRYRNNLDITEIAEKMNVNKRTVSKYIYLGLRKISHFFVRRQEN
jgi:RNA polymerase sigma factor (sigma-70 family)